MKKIIGILSIVIIFIGLSGCGANSNKDTVVLFSCMEEKREASLIEHLEERFPDYEIILQHYSTGDCGAKISAEGVKTKADIIVGLQCASLETVEDSLANVSTYKTAEYLIPSLNPGNGKYWVWEKYDGGIVVNTEVLEKEGLPEPHSYEDLLNPIYKEWIVMPTAKTSGAGYMFFNNWYNMWGEEEAFVYLNKLQVNVSQFVSSGHNVTQLLLSGENAIGLIDLMNIYHQIADGAPVKIIIPDSGAPFNITGTAIIKGKEKNNAVQEVYEYLMTDYVIYDNSNFSPGNIFVNQTQGIPGYPQNVPMADMSTITDNELKNDLVSKWKY